MTGRSKRAFRRRLATGRTAIGVMRHLVGDQLRAWGLPEGAVEDVVLTTHELVANALLHGKPPIDLRLVHTGSELIVEVHDRSIRGPRPRNAALDEESGRGLRVVEALATRWGSRVGTRSKTVWARHTITS
jgi:anti-sigma regulatory factor (Ser/Thr protein kinase)